jgi:hypothetical protein
VDKWTQLGRPGGVFPGDYSGVGSRVPQTSAALEDLSSSIDKLDAVASEFIGRIGRALCSAENGGGQSGGGTPGYSCELANSIQQRAEAVRQITAHMAEALARLEI